ncbi:MAG TPA: DUF4139 domain-containing protein [Bryobacteraceae bacterium]|nr:DUF4139 domain-containing protein [Bryobacteraceae bacterium]
MQRILVWTCGLALSAMAAELPVRQVVLYKHGVGYFERAGELAPGESARLDFRAAEMDDVLKSLTVEEKGGGKISGLRYDSSEPLAHKLADFPFQLGAGQPLSAVLDQLKGARIEMKFANESVAGAIVAARLAPGDDKRPEREQITLLMDAGDLRNFDLGAASGIRFTDNRLETQFKDYLTALAEARSKEKRAIYIDSANSKRRTLVATYMAPMPVWKSSYRLIFGAGAQPTLEGWAIVDNTTDEDWNNVDLSLVSGRPVSFISRLYEPRYVARQTADLPEDYASAPVVYEGGIPGGTAGGVIGGIIGGTPTAAPPPPPAAPEQFAKLQKPPAIGRDLAGLVSLSDSPEKKWLASTVVASAAGRELGELFEYRIQAPVTVRRNESAMLPFLQQKVDTRKLLIYSDPSSSHPMNAAEVINSTGKTLDGGPITVYDSGAYAGEALMETVKSGDKRLISYGVDLGTRITNHWDSKAEQIREIHARRGILTTRNAALETLTYTIHNVDQKAKTLIIEHPARPEYNLLEPKPWEKTSNAYRFEVKLAPGATEKFPVTEERVYENSFVITDLTPDVLFTYVRNKTFSDAARKQLEQIANLKEQIAGAGREMQSLEGQINDIVSDQQRLRQNIGSLNQVSGQQQQVQAYAQRLASQESQLATLRDRRSELDKKRAALESEVSRSIEGMAF